MNKRPIYLYYIDGDEYVFMNNDDYTPYNFKKDEIEDELLFITEEIQGMSVVLVDGEAVAFVLTYCFELVIVEKDT